MSIISIFCDKFRINNRAFKRGASLLSVAAVLLVVLILLLHGIDAVKNRIKRSDERVERIEQKLDVVSARVDKIEASNLKMLEFTKGRIGLDAPPPEDQKRYKKMYRMFIAAELGGMPKVKLYWADPVKMPAKEQLCLAMNIYQEAMKEPVAGQIAVGQVTVNRFESGKWGSLCDVVFARAQFSWTLDKSRNAPYTGKHWTRAKKSADDVIKGLRVAGVEKATFYHADYIPAPKWVREKKVQHAIGRHIFYKDLSA